MRRHPHLISLAILFGALAAPAIAAPTPWRVTNPPYHTTSTVPFAPLNSISASSPDDVWSVGQANGVLLADHFNGAKWSTVALPSGPCSTFEADCTLTGVSDDPSGEAIAVGYGTVAEESGWVTLPLAFAWTGSAWTAMTVAKGISSGALEHVQTFSPSDAWAVGADDSSTPARATATFWDGTSWTSVSTPIAARNGGLTMNAISGSSPSDIWAVGETETGGYGGRKFTSVIMHYNGRRWAKGSVPDQSGLIAVAALSPGDAWALAADGSILNWDGTAWSVQSALTGATTLTALSPNDVWVASAVSFAHDDGSTWTTSAAPGGIGALYGAASLTPGEVWFAGIAYKNNGNEVPVVASTSTG